MQTLLRSVVLGLLLPILLAAAAVPAMAEEPVVLTVVGNISRSNRGPIDEFADAMLKAGDREFDKAFAFTRADLLALPQQDVTANAAEWPGAVELSGPLLRDVLAAAGAAGDMPAFVALDGYTIEFEPGEMASREWVLAVAMNGEPLAIGGRGPVWLVHDTKGERVSADAEARWVYAIFLIEAR